MRLTLKSICGGVVGTLFLLTPLLAADVSEQAKSANTATYNWAHAEKASSLLQQIHSISAQLTEDSDFLEGYTRRDQTWNLFGWRMHALQLNQIRHNVNAMGENLRQLQEIQSTIAPWQQRATDRIMPTALALAAHTEGAIEYLNDVQGNLWVPTYTDRLSAMSDHSEEIKSTVSMFLDYGQTTGQLEGLERNLEFTGS